MSKNGLKNICLTSALLGMVACGPAGVDQSAKVAPEIQTLEQNIESRYDYTANWLNVRLIPSDTANAPNLILIPGLVSSSKVWDGVIANLAQTHNLHIVDVSGFAGTPSPKQGSDQVINGLTKNLTMYIKEKNLQNVTLMGHSMGGFTALKLAHSDAVSLDKIIIVDALPFYPTIFNPAATTETAAPQADSFRDMIMGSDAQGFERMQKQSVGRMSKKADAQKDILVWSLASDRSVMANAVHNLMTDDMRPHLSDVTTNVHVIYAWDEVMGMPAAQMESFYTSQYSGLPHVELTRIEDSFHFIMKDQPEEFLTAVQTALTLK